MAGKCFHAIPGPQKPRDLGHPLVCGWSDMDPPGCFKKWETVKAAERNEVKSLRFPEPLQVVWHRPIVIGLRLCLKTRSSHEAAMNGAQPLKAKPDSRFIEWATCHSQTFSTPSNRFRCDSG